MDLSSYDDGHIFSHPVSKEMMRVQVVKTFNEDTGELVENKILVPYKASFKCGKKKDKVALENERSGFVSFVIKDWVDKCKQMEALEKEVSNLRKSMNSVKGKMKRQGIDPYKIYKPNIASMRMIENRKAKEETAAVEGNVAEAITSTAPVKPASTVVPNGVVYAKA